MKKLKNMDVAKELKAALDRSVSTVSPKRKYTLLLSQVLRTEEGQMKSRGCAKPTIELVQTGPSLILKFKEMAAYQQKL